MKSFDSKNRKNRINIPTNDGFTCPGDDQPLRYIGGKQQNVFYLHGSLFLLQDGLDILKMARDAPMEQLANLRLGNNTSRQIYIYDALSANVWV